jgi:replicative DNA helicase
LAESGEKMNKNPLAYKYYEFLLKLYKNINNENIRWVKARNAEYYTADIKGKFQLRLSHSVANLANNHALRMFDDMGTKIFEISTEKNGQDMIEFEDHTIKISDILEEIYEWAIAYSADIIDKIDAAKELLDSIERSSF